MIQLTHKLKELGIKDSFFTGSSVFGDPETASDIDICAATFDGWGSVMARSGLKQVDPYQFSCSDITLSRYKGKLGDKEVDIFFVPTEQYKKVFRTTSLMLELSELCPNIKTDKNVRVKAFMAVRDAV